MDGSRRLVLLALNEVNFDVVDSYVKEAPQGFPNLARLLSGASVRSTAEETYELLEPWIQWPSIHTGLPFSGHRIFRLGDVVGSSAPQVFERLEAEGLKVGCVSAMNAENRLRQPAYFIPDPWTKTAADSSWWSRVLAEAISQTVNDNSLGRISTRSAFHIALGLARFARPRNYALYARLAGTSKGAPWRKALLLDLFLHDLHTSLFRRKSPHFSTVFLNAGAHIQHHYFFSSSVVQGKTGLRNPEWYVPTGTDPIREMLVVYDRIVGQIVEMEDTEVVVSTGLTQKPYDRLKYYYRLREHAKFLELVGVRGGSVAPRMTRDFVIDFQTREAAEAGEDRLRRIKVHGTDQPLFGEIDNRGESLFVTLTYPLQITSDTYIDVDGRPVPLLPHVTFVALKNGMHHNSAFSFFSKNVAAYAPADGSHVKDLHSTILRFLSPEARRSHDLAGSGSNKAGAFVTEGSPLSINSSV